MVLCLAVENNNTMMVFEKIVEFLYIDILEFIS